jgi:hypothetical protein
MVQRGRTEFVAATRAQFIETCNRSQTHVVFTGAAASAERARSAIPPSTPTPHT